MRLQLTRPLARTFFLQVLLPLGLPPAPVDPAPAASWSKTGIIVGGVGGIAMLGAFACLNFYWKKIQKKMSLSSAVHEYLSLKANALDSKSYVAQRL